jgi:hypothetical protein
MVLRMRPALQFGWLPKNMTAEKSANFHSEVEQGGQIQGLCEPPESGANLCETQMQSQDVQIPAVKLSEVLTRVKNECLVSS